MWCCSTGLQRFHLSVQLFLYCIHKIINVSETKLHTWRRFTILIWLYRLVWDTIGVWGTIGLKFKWKKHRFCQSFQNFHRLIDYCYYSCQSIPMFLDYWRVLLIDINTRKKIGINIIPHYFTNQIEWELREIFFLNSMGKRCHKTIIKRKINYVYRCGKILMFPPT